MVRYGRGEDGVYRDPAPRGARLIMLGLALMIVGMIAILATRCHRAKQAAVSPAAPLRISCVGDSITYGFGLANRDETCWTVLLASLLPEGSETANFGVSGSCAMSSSAFPWEQTAQAQLFRTSEEDLVLVMLGTNDVAAGDWDAQAFEAEYAELIAAVMEKPNEPRVAVMLPPAVFGSPVMEERLVNDAIPAMRRVAAGAGCAVIDLHALTEGHGEWFPDGLHPNEEGNAAIAAYVGEALLASRP